MIDVSGWRKRQIMAEDDDDIQDYKKPWVGLEKTDMPDGEDPMYDHPFFIAGMVWAANKLRKKNT
jgi:hypothetical protein